MGMFSVPTAKALQDSSEIHLSKSDESQDQPVVTKPTSLLGDLMKTNIGISIGAFESSQVPTNALSQRDDQIVGASGKNMFG